MRLRMTHRMLLTAGVASAFAVLPAAAAGADAPGYTTIDVPGAAATFAVGVNDPGAVVGLYVDSTGNNHGFADWHGTITSVDVPGATSTVAAGVNDRGVIVGYYTGSNGSFHGFADRGGRFTTIDDPHAG